MLKSSGLGEKLDFVAMMGVWLEFEEFDTAWQEGWPYTGGMYIYHDQIKK